MGSDYIPSSPILPLFIVSPSLCLAVEDLSGRSSLFPGGGSADSCDFGVRRRGVQGLSTPLSELLSYKLLMLMVWPPAPLLSHQGSKVQLLAHVCKAMHTEHAEMITHQVRDVL